MVLVALWYQLRCGLLSLWATTATNFATLWFRLCHSLGCVVVPAELWSRPQCGFDCGVISAIMLWLRLRCGLDCDVVSDYVVVSVTS